VEETTSTEEKESIMRKSLLTLASGLALLAAGVPLTTRAQSGLVDGTVTKIDATAGKITLKHGPLKKLDMEEPMTMVFRVQDPAMLKQVKVGDKIKFDAERVNGQITVTKLQKAR
jgi:Cu(I)/Ag(I) efflux system protein CusF